MKKVAIVTDSNSGITQKEAKEAGISLIAMPFTINEEEFFEEINLSQEEFYKKLEEDMDIATSQPNIADIMEIWDELLEEYDEVLHMPMSSALSGSMETASAMAKSYEGKVQVVDNKRISVTMKAGVYDAIKLRDDGLSAQEIKEKLEEEALSASIYITVDTLKYLKKGGRVTAAGAAIGTVLNIKPVLKIDGGKLDAFAKARGFKVAKNIMKEAIGKDIDERFDDCKDKLEMRVVYSYDIEAAEEFKSELEEIYPDYEIKIEPLSLSVACHIGPGALAVAVSKRL